MNMTVSDLEQVTRAALRGQLPLLGSATIDRITEALTGAILRREQLFRDLVAPADRAALLERLDLERQTPLPRREMPASAPNADTPAVVAERLAVLALMPGDDGETDHCSCHGYRRSTGACEQATDEEHARLHGPEVG